MDLFAKVIPSSFRNSFRNTFRNSFRNSFLPLLPQFLTKGPVPLRKRKRTSFQNSFLIELETASELETATAEAKEAKEVTNKAIHHYFYFIEFDLILS